MGATTFFWHCLQGDKQNWDQTFAGLIVTTVGLAISLLVALIRRRRVYVDKLV